MDERETYTEVQVGTEATADRVTFTTLRFGEVSVPKERVLAFPRGLVGLGKCRRFVFFHPEEDTGPFFWMQAVDDPALAFVVTEPQNFFPEYQVPLGKEEQNTLQLLAEEDGVVCVILVVPEDPRHITANLRGPLVINMSARVGLQLVLSGDEYSVREPLFQTPGQGAQKCSS